MVIKRVLVAIIFLFSIVLFNIIVKAEDNACGDNAVWEYENETLTISGSGEMYDYVSTDGSVPWFKFKDNIKNLVISEGITYIGNYAFYAHYNIEYIKLSDTVVKIGTSAFESCNSISKVIIPSIDMWFAIEFANAMANPIQAQTGIYVGDMLQKDIAVPDGVSEIKSNAFVGYTKLESISIPDTVKTIGLRAFMGCVNLKSVSLAQGITEIKRYAFYNCLLLDELFYAGTSEEWNNITIAKNNDKLTDLTVNKYFNAKGTILYGSAVMCNADAYEYTFKLKADAPVTGALIVALYNNERFVDSVIIPVENSIIRYNTPDNSVIVTDKAATDYKVFFWGDMENLKQLAECAEGKIE